MAAPGTSGPAYVYVRGYGGEPTSSAVLAPKLGTFGVPPKKAAEEIVKHTQAWKGVKIMIKLTIENRQVSVEAIPTTTSLIIKALKEPLRDRKHVKNIQHSGNLSLDTILEISRNVRATTKGIPSKTLRGTVMEVLGTANAVGCTVNHTKPKLVQQQIREGSIQIPAQ